MTFLVLGTICTRGCPFCAIAGGSPLPPDPEEPGRLAAAVAALGLSRVVVTTVTRDDLADGGASHIAACHGAIAASLAGVRVELLLPDFRGEMAAVTAATVFRPDTAGHDVETVPRLYPFLRPGGDYRRSLRVLEALASLGLTVRSALMVGLGESQPEVLTVLGDLRAAGCSEVVIGQYLPPSSRHVPAASYIAPETFDEYRAEAYSLGFRGVVAEPLARSSMRQVTVQAR
jgi:lipoic acid synthetase